MGRLTWIGLFDLFLAAINIPGMVSGHWLSWFAFFFCAILGLTLICLEAYDGRHDS